MAELLLKVGDGAGYEDGDVIAAINDRQIRRVHAEMICRPRLADGRRVGGFLAGTQPLLQTFLEAVFQYRFQRVAETAVLRTERATGQTMLCSADAIDARARIDAARYVKLRKKAGKKPLFGTEGREIWYGGRTDFTPAALDIVWGHIETHTPHRAEDFLRWPLGRLDARHHLAIAVDDFDNEVAAEMVEPLTRPADPGKAGLPHEILKKRRHRVRWQDLPGLSPKTSRDVLDRSKAVDIRDAVRFVRASILERKKEA